ncbi:MAG: hypothetical protein NPIRA01_07280 [Nitrospirales bacterium]|nr:MAG: hypothetical protein NPIRA01_07280 [Nitrospirales bacterium]
MLEAFVGWVYSFLDVVVSSFIGVMNEQSWLILGSVKQEDGYLSFLINFNVASALAFVNNLIAHADQ